MGEVNTKRLLEIFDNLSSGKESRRVKVRVLGDYFGSIMTRIGKSSLGLEGGGIHKRNLKTQWGLITGRLESLPNFSISPEFNGLVPELKSYRDNVAHNYLYFPPKGKLGEIRDKTEAWSSWLKSEAERYEKRRHNLSAKEALEELIEENLRFVLNLGFEDFPLIGDHYNQLKQRSEDCFDTLEKLKRKKKVTNEHIHLLQKTIEFKQQSDKLTEDAAAIGEDLRMESYHP